MKITILPKTTLGKWSVGLIIVFVLLILTVNLLIRSGQEGGETVFDNPLLSIPMLLALICSTSSLITGLIGVIKSKERSVLVFLAMLVGLLVMVFVLGEFISPE